VPRRDLIVATHHRQVAERQVDRSEAAGSQPAQDACVCRQTVIHLPATLDVASRGDGQPETGHPAAPDEVLGKGAEVVNRQRVALDPDLVVIPLFRCHERHGDSPRRDAGLLMDHRASE
jgi:hypothetical protein